MITTENERRILGALARCGPLTKGDLINLLGVSWATIVKLVNRLVDGGVVVRAGTAERELPVGKNSYLYDLSPEKPTAVGVDVEYSLTRLVLTNLRGEVLASRSGPTRPGRSVASFVAFLGEVIGSFLSGEAAGHGGVIDGVGVVIPAFIVPSRRNIYAEVAKGLADTLPYPVIVENNVRAYTLYFAGRIAPPGNFIVATVRTGIGCGIYLDGELYRGESGLSGEISHLKVASGGKRCRCGRSGCLETEVNENLLCEQARRLAAAKPSAGAPSDGTGGSAGGEDGCGHEGGGGPAERTHLLSRLFSSAAEGDPEALSVVRAAAGKLAQALAALLVTFDIPRIYLGGHFGKDGAILARLIRGELELLVDRRFGCNIAYRPIDDSGFLLGAALLVLNGYLGPPQAGAPPQPVVARAGSG